MKNQLDRPELFFGVVGASGTDLDAICKSLENSLIKVGYEPHVISLSDVLQQIQGLNGIDLTDTYTRIDTLMDAGNNFRKIMNNGAALSILTFLKFEQIREKYTKSKTGNLEKHAFILKSLKHKDEVNKFRQVYGTSFWLISAYSPRKIRADNLAKRIASSKHDNNIDRYRDKAEYLIQRDEYEQDKFGQNVRETFPLADIFIDASKPDFITEIDRFIALLFGNLFITPYDEEYSMFHAFASSLKSSSLSRQVGAAISTEEGDIISTGMNEVPKAGGGLYGANDKHYDKRDFQLGSDFNHIKRRQLLADVLSSLIKQKWLVKQKSDLGIKNLVNEALDEDIGILKDAQLMDLTEFGREVHAEMAALIGAARRTIGVNNCTLYTTTFPCHNCAKHIVAAGIKYVIYIEPYPKSVAKEMFGDSVSFDSHDPSKVNFRSFVGVAPRRYADLFSIKDDKRKLDDGLVKLWDSKSAKPRFFEKSDYMSIEMAEISTLKKEMLSKKLGVQLKKV